MAHAEKRADEAGGLSALVIGASVAGAVFLLGFERGAFTPTTRNAIAIATLWALALTALVASSTFRVVRGLAAVPALTLTALGLLSLASSQWGASGEAALDRFDRCVFYAAAYVLVLVASRGRRAAWRDGIAVGITCVGLLGLASRLAPGVVSAGNAFDFLPVGYIRLSYPVGYWNALGVLVALAVPLLLRAALENRHPLLRALALVPLPALAGTLYLTSSRGGFLSLGVGVVLLVVLSRRRWATLGTLLVAGAGSVVAVHALLTRRELVNGPLDSAVAISQRGGAAIQIAAASIAVGIAYALLVWAARRVPARINAPEWTAATLVVVVVVAAIVAVHPVRVFDQFRQSQALTTASPNYVQEHLLSSSANDRWQLWTAAVNEFRAHPVLGGGVETYKQWWFQHRPVPLFVQSAHSLYLESLAELGVLGLVLIALTFGTAGVAVARAIQRFGPDARRADAAAFAASFGGFVFAAGFDWVWDVPGVAVAALAVLALLSRQSERPWQGTTHIRPEGAVAAWLAAAVAAVVLLYAQAAPLLAQRKVESSYAAAQNGDTSAAYRAALNARDLEPWATTPYLQLALLDESADRLPQARRWIAQAISHDRHDWELRVVGARIAARQGAIRSARKQLAEALRLNPFALSGGPVG